MTTSVARPSPGLSEYRTSPSPFASSRPSFDGPALSPLLYDTSSRRSSSEAPPYLPHAAGDRKSSTPIQLPGLAALASIASDVADSRQTPQQYSQAHAVAMSYATSAPGQNLPGQQAGPPVCQNCSTQTTPLWRRDDHGNVLCNACGLFLKLHGRARPISLKTDVIKSRNRVKGPSSGSKKKANISPAPGPLTATHPDTHRSNDGSPRPDTLSHFNTAHSSNIAPQHMFDNTTLNSFGSGATLPRINSPATVNGEPTGNQLSYEALLEQNNRLKTRVSELEVINDLFRGRVAELERAERDARHQVDELTRAVAAPDQDHETNRIAADNDRVASERVVGEKRSHDSLAEDAAAAEAAPPIDGPTEKRRRLSDQHHDESANAGAAEPPAQ